MGVNGHVRWRSSNVTMADMVKVLRREMSSDVVDGTGLKGNMTSISTGSDVRSNIFQQLPLSKVRRSRRRFRTG